MKWPPRTLTWACVALALAACSKDAAPTQATVTVPWRDYDPTLQAKIDAMAAAKDCQGLLIQFNEIGGTNLAVRNQFGHGNEEILGYIDKKERAAGCFPSVTTTS
jgi:hypothetical protein